MTRSTGAGRHDVSKVPDPAAGLPGDMPKSEHNSRHALAIVAINDAYDPQRRVRALARIDLLDAERRSGYLDEASYSVGREVERVFENMNRISGGGQFCEGDRLDAATQAEVRALLGIERAYAVNAFLRWMHRHLGTMDTLLLWRVLGCRMSIATTAVSFGRDGRRGYRYVHDRLCDALGTLATAKAAKGRELR